MLYLHCFRQVMLSVKEKEKDVKTTTSAYSIKVLTKKVLNGRLFGFAAVDIEVLYELYEKFSKMTQPFVIYGIKDVPERMNKYEEATGWKVNKNSKKHLNVIKAKKILAEMLLETCVECDSYKQNLLYKSRSPFEWFLKEVAQTQRETGQHEEKKIAGGISIVFRKNDWRCCATTIQDFYSKWK